MSGFASDLAFIANIATFLYNAALFMNPAISDLLTNPFYVIMQQYLNSKFIAISCSNVYLDSMSNIFASYVFFFTKLLTSSILF